MKKENKEIIKGLSGFLIYTFIGEIFLFIVLFILHIHYSKLSEDTKFIITTIYGICLLITITIINIQTLKSHFIQFKKNIYNYIKKYYKYIIIVFFSMLLANIIIQKITHIQTSANQQIVLETFKKHLFLSIISTVLVAPLLEELVFRLSIRKAVPNKYLFIILSGLSFGIMHMTSSNTWQELLYVIPYTIPGCIFAYTLVKSDNIFVPISLHFTHNFILLAIQLFTLF